MKNFYLLLVTFLSVFILNSCSKDSPSTESIPTTTGVFKCKINGVQKTFGTNTFLTDGQINVVAYIGSKENSTETIWLTVDQNSTSNWDLFYVDSATLKRYDPEQSFTVNITNNSTTTKTIKGTFSGDVLEFGSSTNRKTLTEGIFDIKY